jgi:hypothetical protein
MDLAQLELVVPAPKAQEAHALKGPHMGLDPLELAVPALKEQRKAAVLHTAPAQMAHVQMVLGQKIGAKFNRPPLV